jgi:DNA polymerase
MHIIKLAYETDFDGWRDAARRLALNDVAPSDVTWLVDGNQSELFAETAMLLATTRPFSVPRAFVEVVQIAILNRDPARFGLFYRLLCRLRSNSQLLEIATDADVAQINALAKAVRRDEHKMHAFVRFREIAVDGRARFVAWFEPEHHIVELAAPFFVDRFNNMDWSILTPERCVHWLDGTLSLSDGVPKSDAPTEDAIEDIWRSYYASIFNPARLKAKAMQTEMPKKYWRNLPEASLIKPLTEMAERRAQAMVAAKPDMPKAAPQRRAPARARTVPPDSLEALRAEAENCRACPLWKDATQTVFGEGPKDAEIMFVGEQPGDKEDLAGRPFVGPAGQVLDRALKDAGIERKKTYVTNAVKHFKFVPRGKIRLHQKPATPEIKACRQWYERELAAIKPALVVAMGATAAQSVFGKITPINKNRGQLIELEHGIKALVTVHPSYLLRLPDPDAKAHEYQRFVDDLRIAGALLKKGAHAA